MSPDFIFCICLKGNMRKMCNFVRRINYFFCNESENISMSVVGSTLVC